MYVANTEKFSEIDHTADIGLRAVGNSLPELFANLAFGMIYIVAGEVPLMGTIPLHIRIQDTSDENLIVTWLSEINYHLNVHHFLPATISELNFHRTRNVIDLRSDLSVINLNDHPIEIKTEIKAVTYHQLQFEKINDTYMAQVIFDI